MQSASDRLGDIAHVWRCGPVEEGYFPAHRSREFFISEPDEIVEDHERFSASGLFDLEYDRRLVAVRMKLVAQLLDEAAIHQSLRRGIDSGDVYGLPDL